MSNLIQNAFNVSEKAYAVKTSDDYLLILVSKSPQDTRTVSFHGKAATHVTNNLTFLLILLASHQVNVHSHLHAKYSYR